VIYPIFSVHFFLRFYQSASCGYDDARFSPFDLSKSDPERQTMRKFSGPVVSLADIYPTGLESDK